MDESRKFKPGDIVVLRSEPRIKMTVVSYNIDGLVDCIYFKELKDLTYAEIPEVCLVLFR